MSLGFGFLYDLKNAMEDALAGRSGRTRKKETKKHAHSFQFLYVENGAPTSSGGITSFTVFCCGGCGQVTFFPAENFRLVTAGYQREIIDALTEKGYKPVIP